MKDVSGVFSFNTGIEQVVEEKGPEAARLPDAFSMAPSEEAVDGKLAEALFTPSLDDRLLAWQKPTLVNREILIPDHYQALIPMARQALSEAAAKAGSRNDRKVFGEAADVLSEEKELADELFTYRNMLHKA